MWLYVVIVAFLGLGLLCGVGGYLLSQQSDVPSEESPAKSDLGLSGASCDVNEACWSGQCEDGQCVANPFVTVWITLGGGDTEYDQIHLPLVKGGRYNFHVDWGDGTTDQITRGDQPEVTHRYAEPGEYTVSIEGVIEGWSFLKWNNRKNDGKKLIEIKNWGSLRLGSNEIYDDGKGAGYFFDADNMTISATDVLNLEGTTSLSQMFLDCAALTDVPGMEGWDVSKITNMSHVFTGAGQFNQDISAWDVSSVTDMMGMFTRAAQFDQDISGWDVSRVTNMSHIFSGAAQFNQDISGWDMSSVLDTTYMFAGATRFDQDISGWDMSSVVHMPSMFAGATQFNQDIGGWDVSSAKYMVNMFAGATRFDQNIGRWNVSRVRDMKDMFSKTSLSTANYDALLLGWSSRPVLSRVVFDAGDSTYSQAAVAAREILESEPNDWVILDGGQE